LASGAVGYVILDGRYVSSLIRKSRFAVGSWELLEAEALAEQASSGLRELGRQLSAMESTSPDRQPALHVETEVLCGALERATQVWSLRIRSLSDQAGTLCIRDGELLQNSLDSAQRSCRFCLVKHGGRKGPCWTPAPSLKG
jgi:hypothetical protein